MILANFGYSKSAGAAVSMIGACASAFEIRWFGMGDVGVAVVEVVEVVLDTWVIPESDPFRRVKSQESSAWTSEGHCRRS